MAPARNEELSPFAPLLIRLSIGFYFVLLGLWGYLEPSASRQAVQQYAMLAPALAGVYVNIAAYLFFIIGVMLVIGWFTKMTAILAAAVLLPLLYGAGLFSLGGDSLAQYIERRSLFRDTVVFAGCLSLVLSGAGALSLDRFFGSIYRRT